MKRKQIKLYVPIAEKKINIAQAHKGILWASWSVNHYQKLKGNYNYGKENY